LTPYTAPKSLNRSSPKFAQMVVSATPIILQNFIEIGQGFRFCACAVSRPIWTKDGSAIFFWGGGS